MAASWKHAINGFLKSTPMISMYGGISLTALYVIYKDYSRVQRMIQTYKSGKILPPYTDNKYEVTYQNRPVDERQIKSLLSNNFTNEYYFIYGEVGVGKTRTIIEVVREMIKDNGSKMRGAPIFVSVDQGKSFPETLAEAVNFNFDEHINFNYFLDIVLRVESFPKKDNQSKLIRVLDAIEESSFKYMIETGKPVVLVIDGIYNLNKQIPDALEKLHDKAKLWADANIVKVIFVNNDEEVEQTFQKNSSSWSRCGTTKIIDELTRSEAISFLTTQQLLESHTRESVEKYKHFSEEDADKVADLVGGKIIDLITFKRDYAKGIPFEVISEQVKDRVREKFIRVSRTPSTWNVIATLRDSPSKSMKLSKLIKLTSKDDVNILTKHDIIRYVREDIGVVVKFCSVLTENVVDELEQMYLQDKSGETQQ